MAKGVQPPLVEGFQLKKTVETKKIFFNVN